MPRSLNSPARCTGTFDPARTMTLAIREGEEKCLHFFRLFYHECLRVFHDRLINVQDKTYFYRLLNNICINTFGIEVLRLPDETIIEKPPVLLFGDFMSFGAAREQRIYEELAEIPKVRQTLEVRC